MAQHDFNIANQTFPNTRIDINNAWAAIVSQSSGATAPSTTYAYQFWYDTTTDLLKIRNADNDAWISVFAFNQTTDSVTLEPNASGDIVLGNVTIDADQTIGAGQDNFVLTYDNTTGKVSLEAAAGGDLVDDLNPQLGGTLDVNSNDIDFGQSNKALFGGAGGDLEIYHNGTNAFIDNNDGILYIRNNVDGDDGSDIYIQAKSGENGIIIQDDGEVRLYYNNVEKLNTSSSGVTVAGTVAATAVTGDGSGLTNLPAASLTASSTIPSEGGAATTNIVQGLAKVWINFNGTGTIAIRDDFNASTIVDNGTGNYTVNFTSSMGNVNYAGTVTGTFSDSGVASCSTPFTCRSFSTSSMRATGAGTGNTGVDMLRMCVSIMGDLA